MASIYINSNRHGQFEAPLDTVLGDVAQVDSEWQVELSIPDDGPKLLRFHTEADANDAHSKIASGLEGEGGTIIDIEDY